MRQLSALLTANTAQAACMDKLRWPLLHCPHPAHILPTSCHMNNAMPRLQCADPLLAARRCYLWLYGKCNAR